jgi:hypothetical protein
MSSAESTSEITVSSRFLLIEDWIEPRMPVTWTWSSVVAPLAGAGAVAVVAAAAGGSCAQAAPLVNEAAMAHARTLRNERAPARLADGAA